MAFWEQQLGMMPLNRGVVALILLLAMAVIIYFGKDLMVRVMSYRYSRSFTTLVLLSPGSDPYWNTAVFESVNADSFQLFPVTAVSFVTGMAGYFHHGVLFQLLTNRIFFREICIKTVKKYRSGDAGKDFTEQKVNKIISRAGLLMVGVVMFFAFSCLFALSPANMAEAKEMVIPVHNLQTPLQQRGRR